jgi:hypothetical protein
MEILEVQEEAQYELVKQYAISKGLDIPYSSTLFYALADDKVIGIIGCEYVSVIEPLAANSGNVIEALYSKALEFLSNKEARVNTDRIECFVSDKKTNANMLGILQKKGFDFIEKNLNRFVKTLI